MNQIINISPKENNILGQFREDSIIVICDTEDGAFSVSMPEGFLTKCHNVTFYNTGTYDVTLNFPVQSMLYFYNGSVTSVAIGGGESVDIFNEPTSGKWRSITDPSVRLIWEDNPLKGQVYQDGEWHTCIKGGY